MGEGGACYAREQFQRRIWRYSWPQSPWIPTPEPPEGVATLGPVRIAIGSDHAGYELKEAVAPMLRKDGHELVDVGTDSQESVDYPDYAAAAARMVGEGEADRAVIVCGSGVGVSIVANKVDGVRAVNAHDADEAEMSRRHNDANVLTLSGKRLSAADANPIIDRFLGTDFEGGRHARRVQKIAAIERGTQTSSDEEE
jgi:ribose 5-phosphate isomerase B